MARRRRKALPREPVTAEVENLTHDGRGIAYVDGKAVFIDPALPGEKVAFQYTALRRDHGCGRVVEVFTPSPDRVSPPCSFFGTCGGCSLQHVDSSAQIRIKQDLLLEQFRRIGKIEPEALWPPLTGPVRGYRRKARLGVRYVRKKGRVLVGFREKGSSLVADIDRCLVLHPHVGERLAHLSDLISNLSIRDQIPQIEVAMGDERCALVLRVLQDLLPEDLERLRAFGHRFEFDLYLQSAGPDSIMPLIPEAPPLLRYRLPEAIDLRFGPLDFTQVNADINRSMIERVLEVLDPRPDETVLDLFCGLGNFTLPLARRGGKVVGVEGNSQAVARGRDNARHNGIANVEFHCHDLTQDLAGLPWAQARYDKLLLDPARTGALEVMDHIPCWAPERIVYVSCNPATLARDVGHLIHHHGYRLKRAGVMDMFPHTAHVESMALLEK
ncbi:MAG: 23S rRNA (uracil(1939)-C(5))-methyltransferase RlmD [Methylohalobius sp. ZOD2]|nr:23S rRNA (uracil(1939)-C(5))-methyltransferase RlmD [Methylothermaceae bacterium]